MKILMLAPQPFFEPRGTPFSVLGRLKALSALGHEVDLITYHIGEDVSIPRVAIHRIPRIFFIRSVKIGPSAAKMFLDIFVLIRALNLLRHKRYDLLHTHEEAGFFGILLSRFFKIRHLYDMHSSLPEQLTNFRFTRFRPLIRLFEWLEYQVIESSSAVITICPSLAEHVQQINGVTPGMMIENVASDADPDVVPDDAIRAFRLLYSLPLGKKIILYTGTFEAYQGLELLIQGAREALRQRDDLLFLIMGGNPHQVRDLQSRVEDLGLSSHFCFTGMRPPAEVPMAIKLCDVLVSPRISGTNTPLKIYSYLRAGKPIVATNLSTHTQVLDADVAYLVEPSASALAAGLLTVLDDPRLARRLATGAQRRFEERYSYQNYQLKTEKVLQLAMG